MAFRKSVWRAVGGFPEEVYAGEDRAFTSAVVAAGFRTARSPDAVVTWRPPGTLADNARMFYTYCRGDVRFPGGRTRHLMRLGAWLLATRCIAGGWRARVAIVLAGGAYIALPLDRARRGRLPARVWWRIPVVVVLKDLAQLAGAGRGVVDAVTGQPQPPPRRRYSRT